jgi:hypothetical protein
VFEVFLFPGVVFVVVVRKVRRMSKKLIFLIENVEDFGVGKGYLDCLIESLPNKQKDASIIKILAEIGNLFKSPKETHQKLHKYLLKDKKYFEILINSLKMDLIYKSPDGE